MRANVLNSITQNISKTKYITKQRDMNWRTGTRLSKNASGDHNLKKIKKTCCLNIVFKYCKIKRGMENDINDYINDCNNIFK